MTYLSSMIQLTLLRLLFQGPTQFVVKYISHLVSLAPRLKLFWTTICGACSVYHILDLHFIGHYQLALAGESEEAPRVRNIFGADGTTMPSSSGWVFICCCSCSGFCSCCCLVLCSRSHSCLCDLILCLFNCEDVMPSHVQQAHLKCKIVKCCFQFE